MSKTRSFKIFTGVTYVSDVTILKFETGFLISYQLFRTILKCLLYMYKLRFKGLVVMSVIGSGEVKV